MKTIDLTKSLSAYKTGWIALNKKNKVVAHAKNFSLLSKKTKGKKEVWAIPVSNNYFGLVT